MRSTNYDSFDQFVCLIEVALERLKEDKMSRKDVAEILTRAVYVDGTYGLCIWVNAVVQMVLSRQHVRARRILTSFMKIVKPHNYQDTDGEREMEAPAIVKELQEATARFRKSMEDEEGTVTYECGPMEPCA